ncbi:MAG: CotH kinase family protein [Clostridia bacterium]|nr:CotH kinase family protein [Clostridia bacterium]
MKKMLISIILALITAIGMISSPSPAGADSSTVPPKVLVAYFSCTGGTQKIAGYIAETLNAALYGINPEAPYTSEDLNYSDGSARAAREQNDPNARPQISGRVEDFDDYDVIFIGYPIWFGQAPKIMYTFVESYDFSGKTVIPFCTSGSSGIGSSAANLSGSTVDAIWQTGARFSADASKTSVANWVNGLEFPSVASGHDCPSAHLKDVDADAWYHEYVDYVVGKGLMKGTAADKFDPGVTTTRAMIVTILYRLENEPAVSGTSPFDDVAAGQWYTEAVIWANANGIVKGYGDGGFGPMDIITREQFAAILYRCSEFKGYDVNKAADLSRYTDSSAVSEWALAPMKWANAENIITGRTATALVPGGEATRAEAAAIFTRFSDLIAEDPYEDLIGTIRLETETGRDVESKKEYIGTTFSLSAPDGRGITYDEISIRGRGQASWGLEKKSYKLKFPEKVCLMDDSGSGVKAKDWTLIACHSDKSLIRNYLGFKLASKLDGIEWTPYGELVHVYLNGEYRGVYLLSEHVEVAKGRVDIKDGTKDNIGFLIEYDSWATGDYNSDMFSSSGIKYSVQSDFGNTDQVIAMKCHLETVFNAVREGDREKIERLVDLRSAIDIYLINEVYRNNDVDWSSFFMYFKEPQGKLFFGPVWDLNLAFGNSSEQTSTSGLAVGHIISTTGKYKGIRNEWLAAFLSNEWFREMAAERWKEIKDALRSTAAAEIAGVKAKIADLERNFTVWDVLNTALGQEPAETLRFKSCLENVGYVENWLNSRIDWLDGYYSSDAFIKGYPADRTKIDPGAIGNTDPVEAHDRWVIPDWFGGEKEVQYMVDNIEILCGITRGRIEVKLGGYGTMTAANVTTVVLGETMNADTERYEMFFDEDEFEDAREQYHGLGNGQSIIFELKTGIRDKITGDESTLMKVKYTFTKDLSLNGRFGE